MIACAFFPDSPAGQSVVLSSHQSCIRQRELSSPDRATFWGQRTTTPDSSCIPQHGALAVRQFMDKRSAKQVWVSPFSNRILCFHFHYSNLLQKIPYPQWVVFWQKAQKSTGFADAFWKFPVFIMGNVLLSERWTLILKFQLSAASLAESCFWGLSWLSIPTPSTFRSAFLSLLFPIPFVQKEQVNFILLYYQFVVILEGRD